MKVCNSYSPKEQSWREAVRELHLLWGHTEYSLGLSWICSPWLNQNPQCYWATFFLLNLSLKFVFVLLSYISPNPILHPHTWHLGVWLFAQRKFSVLKSLARSQGNHKQQRWYWNQQGQPFMEFLLCVKQQRMPFNIHNNYVVGYYLYFTDKKTKAQRS